jgi:hypothetical protein
VQLLLRDEIKNVKETHKVKEEKAGGSAGLLLLMHLTKDS